MKRRRRQQQERANMNKSSDNKLKLDADPAEADLLNRAGNVDKAIAEETQQSQLQQAMNPASDPAAAEIPPTPAPVDAAMLTATLTVLVTMTVDRLHTKWDWSDPGEVWRNEVGLTLAQLADKYLALWTLTGHTQEIQLCFLLLPYIIENAITKGFPPAAPAAAKAPIKFAAPDNRHPRGDGVREEYSSPVNP